jgi:hypothetical protein
MSNAAGATMGRRASIETPAMMLMTASGARKASSDSAPGASCGRRHRSTTSARSTTAWLLSATLTDGWRAASLLARPALRGDSWMEAAVSSPSQRPVTIFDQGDEGFGVGAKGEVGARWLARSGARLSVPAVLSRSATG